MSAEDRHLGAAPGGSIEAVVQRQLGAMVRDHGSVDSDTAPRSLRRVLVTFASGVILGAIVGIGLSAGFRWLQSDPDDDYGVTEDEVWIAAVDQAMRAGLSEGSRAMVVAYGGELCGGVVEITDPEGSTFWSILEDSGAPVVAGTALMSEAEALARITRPGCEWE